MCASNRRQTTEISRGISDIGHLALCPHRSAHSPRSLYSPPCSPRSARPPVCGFSCAVRPVSPGKPGVRETADSAFGRRPHMRRRGERVADQPEPSAGALGGRPEIGWLALSSWVRARAITPPTSTSHNDSHHTRPVALAAPPQPRRRSLSPSAPSLCSPASFPHLRSMFPLVALM